MPDHGIEPAVRRAIWRWTWVGVPVLVVAGSALHFLFAWTGEARAVAWLAAVNESVWEHTKLAFWPGLAYGLLELASIGRRVRNAWLALFVRVLSMPAVIIALFYGYTAILGDNVLALDVSIFLVAVVLGQVLAARIMLAPDAGRALQRAGLAGLAALVLFYATASYRPPRLAVFQDSGTGQYGIVEDHH
jgi:hypothetical protein